MNVWHLISDAAPALLAAAALAGMALAGWRWRRATLPAAARIDQLLPQTQCGQCGYAGCRPYAEAIGAGHAGINRCPPGGERVIRRLAALTGQPVVPLDASCGRHKPPQIARIDEQRCIGCTLCIQACPVDAIVGAAKLMHTVVVDQCTGCELCLPPCPVDCIDLAPAPRRATSLIPGHAVRSADAARARFVRRQQRLDRERHARAERLAAKAEAKLAQLPATSDPALERKRAIVAAAVARARAKLATLP